MSGATKTTLATAIQTVFQPDMVKTFYEGTPMLNFFGTRPSAGGDSIDWKLNYAGNAGYIYNEGDAQQVAGNQSFADMTIAHIHFANTCQITGHARDAMKNGYFDGVKKELDGCMSGLMHKVEEKLVTVLEGAINDDTTYGGQTRATVHADSHVVAGGSAALTLAMLSAAYETLQLDPRGVQYQPSEWAWISSPEQRTAYTEVATGLIVTGDAEAAGANLPYSTSQSDPGIDAGKMNKVLTYNSIPWVTFATSTNTLVLLVKKSNVLIEEARPLTIEPLAKTDDSDTVLMTWAGSLAYLDPYRAARIEALAT